ncbi:hypothetical protein CLIB1423_23S01574 [[Candida] railenensis]|uniref:non-specific serine/threonine protein kinase n=1 Tax=[Candida] railenensis TaxID=45579 RepID=A0A9P0QUJ0_9ASCO|nr:hypothetical protein CLIB1423_23S01574 [[Candida] railenensis]
MLLLNKAQDLISYQPEQKIMTESDLKKSKFNFGGFFKKKIPNVTIAKTEVKNTKDEEFTKDYLSHLENEERKAQEEHSQPREQPPSIPYNTSITDGNNQSTQAPPSILDNANHITVVQSIDSCSGDGNPSHVNAHIEIDSSAVAGHHKNGHHDFDSKRDEYHPVTHVTSPSHLSVNYQERYTSFTTDCISLQNSDMTSHMDEDSNYNNPMNYSPIGKRLLDDRSSMEIVRQENNRPKSTLKSILKNRTEILRVSVKKGVNSPQGGVEGVELDNDGRSGHSDLHSDIPSELHSETDSDFESTYPIHPYDEASASSAKDVLSEAESEADITAYLSDCESDLNFDPLQEENANDYKKGGYHPVAKAEIYYSKELPGREYIILRKLGWGHFSTVWLAKSLYNAKKDTRTDKSGDTDTSEYYVAIKFVKSNKHYLEAAEDEISLLQTINQPLVHGDHLTSKQKQYFEKFQFNKYNEPIGHPGFKNVMKLLDNFEILGPNGTHICMVFEILGENVFNLMCKYKNFYSSMKEELKLKKENQKATGVVGAFSFDTLQSFNFGTRKDKSQVQQSSSTNGGDKKKRTISKLSLGLLSGGSNNNNNISPTCNSNPSPEATSLPTSAQSSVEQDCPPSSVASSIGDEFLVSQARTSQIMDEKIHSLDIKSLSALMDQSKTYGGLPLLIVKQIAKQIFLALDYIHHCGVIHTDLKPENILIEIKDITKLIKMIENDKIAKHNEKKNSGSSFLSRKTSKSTIKEGEEASVGRKSSNVSSSSSFSSCGYRKSRVSSQISKRGSDTPIRSSKPLPSSITTDIVFKNVSYKQESPMKPSFGVMRNHSVDTSMHSPTDAVLNAKNSSYQSNNSMTSSITDDNSISVKIADLGNGTFSHTHFTDQIQTRQYRSPEIILGYKKWGASTDLWSVGCMIFELITGDYLFDPHDGKHYDRDDDHMAQIVELLGGFPSKEYLSQCNFAKDFFKIGSSVNGSCSTNSSSSGNNEVRFRKIPHLKYWPLHNVLVEKYHFSKDDPNVAQLADLIGKCLTFETKDRVDAGSLSNHPWFYDCAVYGTLDGKVVNGEFIETHGEDVPGYCSPYSIDQDEGNGEDDNGATEAFFE